MSKLPTLKSKVATLAPRIGVPVGDRKAWLKQRDQNVSWRKWYRTPRWRQLRWQTLTKAMFTCAICGKLEADTSLLVCDHIKPHRGNEALFYDENNLQCLCKHCHDSIKQREEKRAADGTLTHPQYLMPSLIPLTIVCGAPASGKSHYVATHKSPDDLVIDMDVIVAQMTGHSTHAWDRNHYLSSALTQRNAMLLQLSDESIKSRYKHAWFIVTEPIASKRQWWQRTLKPTDIIVMETSEEQCLANADKDKDRNRSETAMAINKWWNSYSPRKGETIVKQP